MSYYEQNAQGGDRPGFTEQSNSGSFNSGAQSYGNNQQGNGGGGSAPAPSYSSNSGGNSNSYGNGGGNSGGGGYGGGGRSGGYGGGGNSGGWKGGGGGSGGGGWKGGGNKGGFNKPPMSPEQLANLQLPKRGIILAGNYGAPESLVPTIREIADIIKRNGFVVRASSTDGFDTLVMQNVPDAEFHIPWKGFGNCHNPKSSYDNEQSLEFAKRYHREWGTLKESHQKFFSKNVRLALGKNLDAHAYAAIIWSEDGVESPSNVGQRSAHAGHIASICHACGIPVINISNPNAVQRLRTLIEGNKNHV